MSGNPLKSITPLSATALQIGYSVGLVSLLGGFGASAQNTVVELSLGDYIIGPFAPVILPTVTPVDQLMHVLQMGCN
jgi:hypothetical protein